MSLSSGDTAWLLVSSALVMLMTPGVALFYGGLVRRKSVLSTMMMSFAALAIVGLLWVLYGYSLSFGPDKAGIIGGLDWVGLSQVGQEPSAVYASTVPQLAFMIFQAMFAIITVALITGAVVERMKFSGILVFSVLWLTVVYCPVAHWVWGSGGWLAELGVLDFAGGIVVHITAGVSALALAKLLGPRKGFLEKEPMEPHNIPMVALGAGLLWTSQSPWYRHWSNCRAGSDNPGCWLRATIGRDTNRYCCSGDMLLLHALQDEANRRRVSGRMGSSRCGRHLGCFGHWHFC